MPKQRAVRRPKRKFSGNQFTKSSRKTAESVVSEEPCASTDANGIPEDTEDIASVSSKKAEKLFPESADEQKGKESSKDGVKDSSITGYRLVDMEILSSVFSSLRCAVFLQFDTNRESLQKKWLCLLSAAFLRKLWLEK